MRDLTEKEAEHFNADFLKIFTGGVGVGLVIFGYSYTHTFFRSFGLSMLQFDMEWIDILFRGTALTQNWIVACSFAAVILLGSLAFAGRTLVGPGTQVLITSLTILAFIVTATWGGKVLGYSHARAIWEGGSGKKAFCKLQSNAPEIATLAEAIDRLTLVQWIRFIHHTRDFTVLAPVFEFVKEDQNTGEAFVIPTKYIVYCRIVGSQRSFCSGLRRYVRRVSAGLAKGDRR